MSDKYTERDDLPVDNPGVEPHVERYTDANPKAGNRAYRQVLTLLSLVPVLAIAFVVVYFAVPRDATVEIGPLYMNASTFGLGLCAGLAVLFIGIACIHWAKQIMGDEEIIQERHPVNSDATDRKEFAKQWRIGAEQSGLSRRKLIGGALGGAIGIMAVPAIVTLADLGPKPGPGTRRATIERTIWAEGVRLVNDVTYQPIKASDLEIGQLVNAEPENLKELEGVEFQRAKAKAAILIVRMDLDSIKIPESRKDWQVGGILSYSKICTHVGCPVNLWEQQTHHLLCTATSQPSTWVTPVLSSSALPDARCHSYPSPLTAKATWSLEATSPFRWARPTLNEILVTTTRRVTTDGPANWHRRRITHPAHRNG